MFAASVCDSRPGALERRPAHERRVAVEDVLDPLAVGDRGSTQSPDGDVDADVAESGDAELTVGAARREQRAPTPVESRARAGSPGGPSAFQAASKCRSTPAQAIVQTGAVSTVSTCDRSNGAPGRDTTCDRM